MEILNNVRSYLSKISSYDAAEYAITGSIAIVGTCLALDVLSYFTADLDGGVGFYDQLNLCGREIKPLSPALYFHTFELFSKYMSGSVESISDAFETSCDYKESFLKMTIPMESREVILTFFLGIGIYGYGSILALMPFLNFQVDHTEDRNRRIYELSQVTNTCNHFTPKKKKFNNYDPPLTIKIPENSKNSDCCVSDSDSDSGGSVSSAETKVPRFSPIKK